MSAGTDVDWLPPTQYLICELLAARHRTGETWWHIPAKVKWALLALADAGLVDIMAGQQPRTFRARLTDAGRAAFMPAVWTPPAPGDLAALLRYAAAGRREYLPGLPEDMRPLVEVEIGTLEAAAVVADGRLDPMYDWLPSWRWTDDMSQALNDRIKETL
ncbi:hypothetical protein Drose_05745 [Dactylosporangium roseum]|uniref:PadR family transcriptional regulator n=1 Tax=Dactylosporangium roseum TaxID=47989 RepID=A0ABY5ZAP8_9ACTN|nr:hypothetical protein [Dactylosporangium roseum]UWZ37773.1 hypothetical protein Drose_05745 [Dactylosporangium roseum]